jgi:pimeloyl-ACP methyl ester carboxylesterase
LDRLDDEAKRALQVAAVIGREFTVRLLERLYQRPDGAGEALEDLHALELIYEKSVYPELSYMFKHALTHDVAYQTLLRAQRVELHRQVAALVEELYFDRLPEFYETLAFQYRRAELPEKAARYALLSAQRAATHLAPEAEHLFREATELAEGREELEDVYLQARAGLGDLLILRGEIDAANDCFHEALRVAPDPKTRRWLANKVAHRHFVEREGVRLAYYIQGEGEPGEPQREIPIVCLHPLIQGSYSFQVLAQRLCQEYCVVYMDPRGTGASDTTDEPYESDTRVRDALAVLEALPHQKLILQGDSDGGHVALELYHAMPERVQQLIIFGYTARASAAPDYPEGHSEEVMKALRHAFLERPKRAAIDIFFKVMSDEPGMSAWREFIVEYWDAAFDQQDIRAFFQNALETDARYLLPGVRVPTLIIAAERDGIPVAQVRYLAEKIPGAQFALIKGASHMAPWTAIETFLELLTTFVRTGTIPREEWET